MEPWATLALTGYSCENFPSRTTWSHLLLRKEEISQISGLKFQANLWRRLACQTPSKALDISSATTRVAPDLLKTLATLPDTTVKTSAVNQEDLKPYWKWEKRPHFFRQSKFLLFTSLSKTLLTAERRLTGQLFLAADLSLTFLNTGTTDQTFQQLAKQDPFRYLLKSSAGM